MEANTAQRSFNELIETYAERIYDFSHLSLRECGLFDEDKIPYRLSQFNDPYDTLIYSRLIEKALDLSGSPELLVDLGCGSSLPTLIARERSKQSVPVLAVDLDQEALEVSRENARAFGSLDHYEFKQGNLNSVLPLLRDKKNCVLVSNPPYIATPPHLKKHELLPIDGGPDGCDYLRSILNETYHPETIMALLWGSLTNPRDILPLIEQKFVIEHFEAYRIHFGHYTSQEHLRDYLWQLRHEGRVHFEVENGEERQLVFGMILRPRVC